MQYDDDFDPPAPTMTVVVGSLRPPQNKKEIKALLDTGADITTVPPQVLNEIQANLVGYILVSLANGQKAMEPTFAVRLEFLHFVKTIEVVCMEGMPMLLGRDVLNSCTVKLDGKAMPKVFEIT